MSTLSRGIYCAIIVLYCVVCTSYAMINPQTILECLPREYTFRVSKSISYHGNILPCWDDVKVFSCWGRCDSFEFGDYKIPFKVSHHPVCTYSGRTSRHVQLRNCSTEHPDPVYEVFDAMACRCSVCDSRTTSCENLNG